MSFLNINLNTFFNISFNRFCSVGKCEVTLSYLHCNLLASSKPLQHKNLTLDFISWRKKLFLEHNFQSRIQDPVAYLRWSFCENSWLLKAVDYFLKKLHLWCSTEFWKRLWLFLFGWHFKIRSRIILFRFRFSTMF